MVFEGKKRQSEIQEIYQQLSAQEGMLLKWILYKQTLNWKHFPNIFQTFFIVHAKIYNLHVHYNTMNFNEYFRNVGKFGYESNLFDHSGTVSTILCV